jgi:O-antigen/teichoic acid export membrane protein
MRTARHFLYNLLGAGLPLLLAVVAVPAIGRHAGYERLGFLTIVWAAVGYLGFLDFGLSRVFSRRVAIAAAAGSLPAEMDFLRWAARRVFLGCCAIALLLALAIPPTWLAGSNPSPEWLSEVRCAWWLLAASIPPLVLASIWRGAMEGRTAFGVVNVLRVGMGAWTFGIPIVLLPFSTSLTALVGSIVLGRWISLLLHQAWCAKNLPGTRRHGATDDGVDMRGRREAFRRTFSEGGWITVSGVVGPMMVVFDRFVLGAVAALSSVAVYAIPQEVVLRMLGVPSLLGNVLFPRLAVLSRGDTREGAGLINLAVRVTLLAMLPACLGLALLAEPILRLWLGSEIAAPATPILRWLLVGCILNTAAQVPFAHLQASGRSWLTARIHLAELLPYGIALYWASSNYGALGAAWVWSARCAVDAAALLFMNRRIEPDSIDARVLATLGVALAATLVATGALGLQASPSFAAGSAAALAVLASLIVGLRPGEFHRLVIFKK